MFPYLERALERYGDQVALLVMIQPLEKECNRLVTDQANSHPGACTAARLAMGIARVNPPSFAKFHEFMMSGDKEMLVSTSVVVRAIAYDADYTESAESDPVTLTVVRSPSFTSQPVSQTVLTGQTATFTAAASGTPPLSYQWFFNGGATAGDRREQGCAGVDHGPAGAPLRVSAWLPDSADNRARPLRWLRRRVLQRGSRGHT
jgi:hypothetical protein